MAPLKHLLLVCFCLVSLPAHGVVTSLAITGDDVPGLPGAKFATFDFARVNATGQAAYIATLQNGVGGITTSNNSAVFAFDGSSTLKAQTGSGNVVGMPADNYAAFQQVGIDNGGKLLLRATLVQTSTVDGKNNQGYWQFASAEDSLVIRSGLHNVPGVGSSKFEHLGHIFNDVGQGTFAFSGQAALGGGITLNNDGGIWVYQGNSGQLVVRDGQAAPGVTGGVYAALAPPAINASNQVATRATLTTSGSITNANRNGVWKFDNGVGQLLARTGTGNAPDSGASFTAFENPLLNASGDVLVRGTISGSNRGLWLYSAGNSARLALANSGGVPDIPSANFSDFGRPIFLDTGKIIFTADLAVGPGGVTASNDQGLWLFDESTSNRMLARQGSSAAGIDDANFDLFERIVPIDDSAIFFQATLQSSPGVVDSSNDQGIWRMPFDGTPELIVRKGDTLAGRTIAALTLPTGEEIGIATPGVSNSNGDLLFHASFTNGDSGLFMHSVGTTVEYSAADFNLDGFVDAVDLAAWQAAYGSTAAGDANGDGITDGADFLIWQRQYTGPGVDAEAQAVPEPSVSLLLAITLVLSPFRTRSRSRQTWDRS